LPHSTQPPTICSGSSVAWTGQIAATDANLFQKFDADLHLAVAEASHNALLIALFRSMNAVRHRVLWGRLGGDFLTPDLRKQYDSQHRGFVDAIRPPRRARRGKSDALPSGDGPRNNS